MKSKLFKDTHGLDTPLDLCTPDKISVCLRLDKCAYDYVVAQSKRLGVTSGEYIEQLLCRESRAERGRVM